MAKRSSYFAFVFITLCFSPCRRMCCKPKYQENKLHKFFCLSLLLLYFSSQLLSFFLSFFYLVVSTPQWSVDCFFSLLSIQDFYWFKSTRGGGGGVAYFNSNTKLELVPRAFPSENWRLLQYVRTLGAETFHACGFGRSIPPHAGKNLLHRQRSTHVLIWKKCRR